MLRAFVGIPLGEAATEAMLVQQAGLPSGRLVPAENFHITLAFLGEQPTPVVEDVHFALDEIRAPAFDYFCQGLDLLGGGRSRAVAAMLRPEPALKHLRDRVVEAARRAGLAFPRERYLPHVTLARLSRDVGEEEFERLRAHVAARSGRGVGPFPAERFVLYRSHLGRSGAAYEEMASYPLEAT